MATMEEIVKQAHLLGYRGEKREEYLKQKFQLLAKRQEGRRMKKLNVRQEKRRKKLNGRQEKGRKKLIARKDWSLRG
ncbi:hypothetical protein PoB_004496300 [Plakobranchus ocellatus]|uniref:30S ribosomal protein S21 n=1 Tax=Plakobranchus ocellatus TaxID=259542 RepID=A0AAV4BFT1_9GAST|nr:hypothetical protein PoB_004496300 [Plakobranchus ocellatus]